MEGEEKRDWDSLDPREKSPGPTDTKRIMDLNLTQHPLTDSTVEEFTLSQYPLQDSRISHALRLDSTGIDDKNKTGQNKFYPLIPDTDSRVSQSQFEEIALDLSSDVLHSALLELSGEEATAGNQTSSMSRDISEGLLTQTCDLSSESIKAKNYPLEIDNHKNASCTEIQGETSHSLMEQSTTDSMFCMNQMKDTLENESNTSSFADKLHQLGDSHYSQYQPDVHHITIGESYLEKRPIRSSTPSSSRYLSQLSIKESVNTSSDESVGPTGPHQSSNDQSGIDTKTLEASEEIRRETEDGDVPKAPPEVIREAGITEYMMPEDRERLVGEPSLNQDTSINQEEREALFAGIYKAPPKETKPLTNTVPDDTKLVTKSRPSTILEEHFDCTESNNIKRGSDVSDPIAFGSTVTAAGDCPQNLMDKLAIVSSGNCAVRSVSQSEIDSDPVQVENISLPSRSLSDTRQASKSNSDIANIVHGNRQDSPLELEDVQLESKMEVSRSESSDVYHRDESFSQNSSMSHLSQFQYNSQHNRDLEHLLAIGPTNPMTILDRETPSEGDRQRETEKEKIHDGLDQSGNREEIFLSSQPASERPSPDNRPSLDLGSRSSSSASGRTLKDDQDMEDMRSKSRHADSPHSQMSESSSTSYRDLPEKLHPSLAVNADKVTAAVRVDPLKFDSKDKVHSNDLEEQMDPDVKLILQKYGEVLSEDGTRGKSIGSESNRRTPTESIAESDDTDLTRRVNRLLQGSDLNRSYLNEDPAQSMTLPLTSGSTTRSDTPPPTQSDPGQSTMTVNELTASEVKGQRLAVRSGSEDTLGERVRHLLGDTLTGGGSGNGSSGRSSLSGSVNFDVLQSDLDEIQRGLAVLQNGELSFRQMDTLSTEAPSRRMSDASEDTVSKVTGSEIGTPRKFSWDYGDLNAEDADGYRFVTSRTDLQTKDDTPLRKEPEGGGEGSPGLPSNTDLVSSELERRASLEGKYTRIAMQLEKETSPQRRVYSNKTNSPLKESNSFHKSDPVRNIDLTLDSEVTHAFKPTRSFSGSEQSLCQQVQDLMERESPQRLAYRYLAEAEDSLRHIQERSSVRQHSSDGDLRNISLGSAAETSSFHISPVPHSFSAYGNVRTLLTTQLNKVTTARFDTSIELKSPFKRHLGAHLSTPQASSSSPDLRVISEDGSRRPDGFVPRVNTYGSVHVELETSLSDYTPSSRPVTMQDYISGTHRASLADRQKERERELAVAKEYEGSEKGSREQGTKTYDRIHHREKISDHRSPQGSGSSLRDKPVIENNERTPTAGRVSDELTPSRDDSAGSSDSVLSSGRRYARTEWHNKSGRSSTTNAGLRPYRPPGSNDLYYVESGTDDGNISVTNSEATVESTHIGSDDARAPSFPCQWLGSRLEPQPQSLASGIYSKRAPAAGSAQALHPIEENKSFEETRHDYKSTADNTVVEENFAAQNRSHHNNSGQQNQTDSSSDRSDHPIDTMYSSQGLEDSAWSADLNFHRNRDAPPTTPGVTNIQAQGGSESYAKHHSSRQTDKALHKFGTPQKHVADRYGDRTLTPQAEHSELYGTYHDEQNASYGDVLERSRPQYEPVGRSYMRHQDASPADELAARLRLYPGEVHTWDGSLNTSPTRFTPLRPDLDGDERDSSGRYRSASANHSPSTYSPLHSRHQPLRSPPPRTAPTPPADRFTSPPYSYRPRSNSPGRMTGPSPESRAHSLPSASTTMEKTPLYSRLDQGPAGEVRVEVDDAHRSAPHSGRASASQRSPAHSVLTGRDREVGAGRDREVTGLDSEVTRHDREAIGRGREVTGRDREVTQQLPSQSEPGVRTEKEKDIQGLWERFQRRPQDRNDRDPGKREVDLGTLSHLFKNPVRYLVHDVTDNKRYESGGYEPEEDIISVDPPRGDRHESYKTEEDMEIQSSHDYTSDDHVEVTTKHGTYRDLPTAPRQYQDSSRISGTTSLSYGSSELPLSTNPLSLREETTLQSIPEDTTLSTTDITSSESNATVSMSTLQLLPDDPRLLKLQTKILRQRQKYEHEKRREQRRREKIQKLEKLLVVSKSGHPQGVLGGRETSQRLPNRGSRHSNAGRYREHESPSRPASSSSAKSTSTPSSARGTGESEVSLTVSEITTDTTTQATIVSDQSSSTLIEMEGEEAREERFSYDTSQRKPKKGDGSICKCCMKKKSKASDKQNTLDRISKSSHQKPRSRSKSPIKSKSPSRHRKNRSPSPVQKRQYNSVHSTSEVPKKHKGSDQHGGTRRQHDEDTRESTRGNGSQLYMEFGNPQTKDRSMSSSQQKRAKSTEGSAKKYRASETKNKEGMKEKCSHRLEEEKLDQERQSQSLEDRFTSPAYRTIGVNVPTPISLSPQPKFKNAKDVTMVSEAVQTTPNLVSASSRSHSDSQLERSYPAVTVSTDSENVQPNKQSQAIRARACQTGLAWYIPMKDPRPWRQPLRERQANAVALGESWPPARSSRSIFSLDGGKGIEKVNDFCLGKDNDQQPMKLSLQDALERFRSDFISRSRERLKHLALKTEERRIQDLHAKQRAELFHVERLLDPNKNAHPYSENLFKPKKRFMTKKEMKDLTNKKYATLDEVKRKKLEEEKLQEYRANRIRAQLYKKKVLSQVLTRKAAWTQ